MILLWLTLWYTWQAHCNGWTLSQSQIVWLMIFKWSLTVDRDRVVQFFVLHHDQSASGYQGSLKHSTRSQHGAEKFFYKQRYSYSACHLSGWQNSQSWCAFMLEGQCMYMLFYVVCCDGIWLGSLWTYDHRIVKEGSSRIIKLTSEWNRSPAVIYDPDTIIVCDDEL